MKKLRQVLIIINLKTLVITALAVISTYFCQRFGFSANFPMTLIATAVVFPIVFSIGGAYKRRENALNKYSSLKAHGRAIYFAARDWDAGEEGARAEKVKELLGEVLTACRELFAHPVAEMEAREERVYKGFSRLSRFIEEDLRGTGLAGGEVSRCNQFLSKMFVAFEDVKHIYQYRTPRTLSAFSDFFVCVLPILYGPYFVAIAKEFDPQALMYVMPVLFTTILVSLDNIQEHLENPFDQVGQDDIVINVEKFVDRLDLE